MFCCMNKNISVSNIFEVSKTLDYKNYSRMDLLSLLNRNEYTLSDKHRDKYSKELIKRVRKFINIMIYMDKPGDDSDKTTLSMLLSMAGYVDVNETMNGYIITFTLDDIIRYLKNDIRTQVTDEFISYINSIVPKSLVFDVDQIKGSVIELDMNQNNEYNYYSLYQCDTGRFATLRTDIECSNSGLNIIQSTDYNVENLLKVFKIPLIVNDISLLSVISRHRNLELFNPINLYERRLDASNIDIVIPEECNVTDMNDKKIDTKITSKGMMLLMDKISKSTAMDSFVTSRIRSLTNTSFMINISIYDLLVLYHENLELKTSLEIVLERSGVYNIIDNLGHDIEINNN